jgi:hypothetical protein
VSKAKSANVRDGGYPMQKKAKKKTATKALSSRQMKKVKGGLKLSGSGSSYSSGPSTSI